MEGSNGRARPSTVVRRDDLRDRTDLAFGLRRERRKFGPGVDIDEPSGHNRDGGSTNRVGPSNREVD
jgi:hypothetical protein